MENSKSGVWLYISIAIIVAVAFGWYWFYPTNQEIVVPAVQTTEEALEALSETPDVAIETNPVKKVPDLNPVEKTNPFKTSNPFQ